MENEAHEFGEHHADTHGHEHLVFRKDGVNLQQRIEEVLLDQGSKQEKTGHDNQQGEVRVQVKYLIEREGDVHGDHHQLTVCQIDDLHHAHDQSHAQPDQGIDAADEHP